MYGDEHETVLSGEKSNPDRMASDMNRANYSGL